MSPTKFILFAAAMATMAAEGLRVPPADLGAVWKRPSKLLRGVVAVIVLVPIVAVITDVVVQPSRPVAVGLAFLAASPLAPFILTKLAKSGEDFRLAASLHVALALLSVVTAPLVLVVLGRVLNFPTVFAPPRLIAVRVFASLIVPFGLGVAVRAVWPRFAIRVQKGLELVGLVALLAIFVALIVRGRASFLEFGARDYLAMALFCVLSLASGHFVAAADDERTTYALESAARNPGVALFLATTSLGPVRGAMLLPYFVVFMVASALYSAVRKRAVPRRARPSAA